jgi:hypothetical protein
MLLSPLGFYHSKILGGNQLESPKRDELNVTTIALMCHILQIQKETIEIVNGLLANLEITGTCCTIEPGPHCKYRTEKKLPVKSNA